MKRILLVQYSSNLDGSAFSGLMLLNGFRRHGWETDVAFAVDGPIRSRYESEGHTCHIVHHRNWLRTTRPSQFLKDFVKELLAAATMARLIVRTRPDVVYVNTAASIAGVLGASWTGTPRFWHIRELFDDAGGEMRAPPSLKGAVKTAFYLLSTHIVVNSSAVASNMLLADSRSHSVVFNAVESGFFRDVRTQEDARERLGLPSRAKIIGVPGTLRPMKGHSFFLEAFSRIAQDDDGVVAAITGGGEEDYVQTLRAQVEALGILKRVLFLGTVSDMSAFYRACDVICVPSKSEPFGRTVIESFASGTPLVATEVGGIRETVDTEETGLLVPFGDVELMRHAICRLLQDTKLRERLSRNAAARAHDCFREEIYQDKILQIVTNT